MSQWWAVPMLISGGLFVGGVISIAWERVPAWRATDLLDFRTGFAHTLRQMDHIQPTRSAGWIWRRLTLPEYSGDFRRSLRKADPAMPILVMICGAAAGTFASLTDGAARTLAFAGIGLLAVILVSSIILAEPVNSQFRRRPEGDVPPDAERRRRLWRRFHLVRTGLAVATLACLVTAVTYA
jgi:Domain of unknown function (DUF1772)